MYLGPLLVAFNLQLWNANPTMWTISLPLRVAVSKNKDFALNLNQYRNAHFHTLNKAKVDFTELALKLIKEAGIPKLAQATLEYIVYPGTRQRLDVNNVCSVVDKFFSDALVEAKILDDDNYQFLAESLFRFGSIDRENPRVDVIVRSVGEAKSSAISKESEQPQMKISTVINLTQLDLSTAIREFLSKRSVTVPEGDFSFTLDNGDSGYQIRFEKSDGQEPVKTKRQKMDPKAAMEKVNEMLVPKIPEVAAVTHLGAIASSELANKEPPPVAAAPVVVAEVPAVVPVVEVKPEASVAPTLAQEPEVTPPPPPKASLFASFKRPSNEPVK